MPRLNWNKLNIWLLTEKIWQEPLKIRIEIMLNHTCWKRRNNYETFSKNSNFIFQNRSKIKWKWSLESKKTLKSHFWVIFGGSNCKIWFWKEKVQKIDLNFAKSHIFETSIVGRWPIPAGNRPKMFSKVRSGPKKPSTKFQVKISKIDDFIQKSYPPPKKKKAILGGVKVSKCRFQQVWFSMTYVSRSIFMIFWPLWGSYFFICGSGKQTKSKNCFFQNILLNLQMCFHTSS